MLTAFGYFVVAVVFGFVDLIAVIIYLLVVNKQLNHENEHLKNVLDKYYSDGWKQFS
jgi:uncharacterized membrane protein